MSLETSMLDEEAVVAMEVDENKEYLVSAAVMVIPLIFSHGTTVWDSA